MNKILLKNKYKQHLFPLLIILFSSVYVHQEYFVKPLPLTHDAHHHLARMANYAHDIKEGQIPPRWAGNLNNRFGYPVFNFNYPLPYIATLPMQILNMSYETMFKRLTMLSLLVAASGMYWLVQSYLKSGKAGVVASLLYIFSPYMTNLIYTRGTVGENLGLAILPWLCFTLINYQPTLYYFIAVALLTTSLFLAHNIFLFISLPIICCVFISRLLRSKNKINYLGVLVPLSLGASMSMFFWIPAWFEKKYTVLDLVPLTQEYFTHFPTIHQLIFAPIQFGFSNPGPVDSLSFSLGLVQLFALIISTLLFILKTKYKKIVSSNKTLIFLLIIIAWLSIFLQLNLSIVIWKKIKLLQYLQFPWRLTGIVIFCNSIVIGWMTQRMKVSNFIVIPILLIIISTTKSNSYPAETFAYNDEYWLNYPLTTSLADENMPLYFDKVTNNRLVDTIFLEKPVSSTPSANIEIDEWKGSRHQYQISAPTPLTIIERTAYFPGWQVKANNHKIPIDYQNPQYPGLITFKLEPGEYEIKTSFTQRTPARLIGNTTSLIGVVLLIACIKWLHQKERA